MWVLDTCALIFDSLQPERLSESAVVAIQEGTSSNSLSCADISLWEIAMLVEHGRLHPGCDVRKYIELVLVSRNLQVLPITPSIAALSASVRIHGDPADRLIAATTIEHNAKLITADRKLLEAEFVPTVW
jgi:PIN domain nuclease of toxin-antitoxin system